MNVNTMNFKTLTTYLSTKETLPEDKDAIAMRIAQECSLGFADDTLDWVLSNNWRGGEGCTHIIKAWKKKDEPEKQLYRANELVKIGLSLSNLCELEKIQIDNEWISMEDIYSKYRKYLDDYNLD